MYSSIKLVSAAGSNQLQLVSSHRNSSQLQDGISLNSYLAAGTRVNRRIESFVTRIKSNVGWSQLQLVSSCGNPSQP